MGTFTGKIGKRHSRKRKQRILREKIKDNMWYIRNVRYVASGQLNDELDS